MKRDFTISFLAAAVLLTADPARTAEKIRETSFQACVGEVLKPPRYYNGITKVSFKKFHRPYGQKIESFEITAQRDVQTAQGTLYSIIRLMKRGDDIALEAQTSQSFLKGTPGITPPATAAEAETKIALAQAACAKRPVDYKRQVCLRDKLETENAAASDGVKIAVRMPVEGLDDFLATPPDGSPPYGLTYLAHNGLLIDRPLASIKTSMATLEGSPEIMIQNAQIPFPQEIGRALNGLVECAETFMPLFLAATPRAEEKTTGIAAAPMRLNFEIRLRPKDTSRFTAQSTPAALQPAAP